MLEIVRSNVGLHCHQIIATIYHPIIAPSAIPRNTPAPQSQTNQGSQILVTPSTSLLVPIIFFEINDFSTWCISERKKCRLKVIRFYDTINRCGHFLDYLPSPCTAWPSLPRSLALPFFKSPSSSYEKRNPLFYCTKTPLPIHLRQIFYFSNLHQTQTDILSFHCLLIASLVLQICLLRLSANWRQFKKCPA